MKIGNVVLDNNVVLAPMAGITDMSFRLLCKEMGVGLVYSELISSKGLYFKDRKTEELMVIDDRERPIALQIFGSDPEVMSKIVYDRLNSMDNVDIIDINMGCPAPKIVKNGDGSALMKEPDLVRRIVKDVVKVSEKPVTVKIRKGWDDSRVNAVEIAKIAQDEGAKTITVHGRTRDQFYSGHADWDIIKAVKENVNIPVIGNGDIFEPEDAKRMLEYTGCDGVMIGRGSRGNPWLIKRTIAYLQKGEVLHMPTDEERISMVLRHLELLSQLKGDKIAVKEMRKHTAWYIKGMRNSAEMRNKINTIIDKEILITELNKYLNSVNK